MTVDKKVSIGLKTPLCFNNIYTASVDHYKEECQPSELEDNVNSAVLCWINTGNGGANIEAVDGFRGKTMNKRTGLNTSLSIFK